MAPFVEKLILIVFYKKILWQTDQLTGGPFYRNGRIFMDENILLVFFEYIDINRPTNLPMDWPTDQPMDGKTFLSIITLLFWILQLIPALKRDFPHLIVRPARRRPGQPRPLHPYERLRIWFQQVNFGFNFLYSCRILTHSSTNTNDHRKYFINDHKMDVINHSW